MKTIILLLLVITPGLAAAQGELFMPATLDARSAGMGRTSIVAATSSCVLFTNPSSVALAQGRQIQAGGRLLAGLARMGSENGRFTPHLKLNHSITGLTGGLGFGSGNLLVDVGAEVSRWAMEIREGESEVDYSEYMLRLHVSARYLIDGSN